MSLKIILAPIAGGDGDAGVLDVALALARRFGAHIDVLHAKGDPRDAVPFLGEGASGALIEQIMAAAQRDTTTKAERAKQTFEAWRKTADLPLIERPGGAVGPSVAWVEETGAEDERVARRGRVADLIVAAQPTSSGAIASTVTFEAALLDTGRPVIVAPPAAGTGIGGGAAVVAWNGSAESARAVSFSLPFLALSTRVVVVAAKEGATAADADPLISYLAWHGVRADTVTPEVHTAAVGPHLLEEAQKIGAGMLVMGAYTHNRLRQMVFGGVTRHVLGHAKLPVLMAH